MGDDITINLSRVVVTGRWLENRLKCLRCTIKCRSLIQHMQYMLHVHARHQCLRNKPQNLQINQLSPNLSPNYSASYIKCQIPTCAFLCLAHLWAHVSVLLIYLPFLVSVLQPSSLIPLQTVSFFVLKAFLVYSYFAWILKFSCQESGKYYWIFSEDFTKFKCYSTRNYIIKILSPHTNKNSGLQLCWVGTMTAASFHIPDSGRTAKWEAFSVCF